MGIANKYNKGSRFTAEVKNEQFLKLRDLYEINPDSAHTIRVVYISDSGKYGSAPVFVCNGYNVNMPQHMLNDMKEAIHDEEFVAAVNAQKLGFKVYEYEANGRTCYGATFIDL